MTGKPLPIELTNLNARSGKMYWATVVCFDTQYQITRDFFRAWKHAGAHYKIYSGVFGYLDRIFRNDFAVSVALSKLFDGFVPTEVELPYAIPTLFTDNRLLSVDPIDVEGIGKLSTDLHVMHKKSLLEAVCQLPGF